MDLKPADRVIYYTANQRKDTDIGDVFKKPTNLGTILDVDYEKREYVIVSDGMLGGEARVPEEYVRAVRVKHWYMFWRGKGFHLNYWFYLAFVIFFMLFIYR